MKSIYLIALLCIFVLSGCNLGPKEKPALEDLVGTYKLTSKSIKFLTDEKGYKTFPKSEITLAKDGSVVIAGLPDCYVNMTGDGNGKFMSGIGRWEVEATDFGYGITLEIKEGGTLSQGFYHGSSIIIKNHKPPFMLQFGIGDPDQDEYINYEKIS